MKRSWHGDGLTGGPGDSWVIVEKATGRAVLETHSRFAVEHLNREKYEAIPALTYLENLNRAIKEGKA